MWEKRKGRSRDSTWFREIMKAILTEIMKSGKKRLVLRRKQVKVDI